MQVWLDAEHGQRVCVSAEIRQVPPVFPSPAVSVLPSRMTTSVATLGRLGMDTPSYVGMFVVIMPLSIFVLYWATCWCVRRHVNGVQKSFLTPPS